MNQNKSIVQTIDEEGDMYRKMVIDRSDYSYIMYTGITEDVRGGTSGSHSPLQWYASSASSSSLSPYVPPTPSITPTISATPTTTPSVTPSISITPTQTPSPTMTPSTSPLILGGTCYTLVYDPTVVDGASSTATGTFYVRYTTSTSTELVQLNSLEQDLIGPGDIVSSTICTEGILGWRANPGDSDRLQPDGMNSITDTTTVCHTTLACP